MRGVRDADRRPALPGLDRAGRDRAPFAGRGFPTLDRARDDPRGRGRRGPAGPLQGSRRPLSHRRTVRRGAAERAADGVVAPAYVACRAARTRAAAGVPGRRTRGVADPAPRRAVGRSRLAAWWGGGERGWGARTPPHTLPLLLPV